jgi:hypothetical protein
MVIPGYGIDGASAACARDYRKRRRDIKEVFEKEKTSNGKDEGERMKDEG